MEDLMCVDLTGSSPLTQTGMVDFIPSRAVIDDAQRKHGRCGYIAEADPEILSGSGHWGHVLLFMYLIGSVSLLQKEWGPR
nr:hypothetical protein [Tanacetum cinerariifolium]